MYRENRNEPVCVSPYIIFFTECLAVSDKASVVLIQHHLALTTLQHIFLITLQRFVFHLETGSMPGQVRRHSEYELVLDESPTPYTGAAPVT